VLPKARPSSALPVVRLETLGRSLLLNALRMHSPTPPPFLLRSVWWSGDSTFYKGRVTSYKQGWAAFPPDFHMLGGVAGLQGRSSAGHAGVWPLPCPPCMVVRTTRWAPRPRHPPAAGCTACFMTRTEPPRSWTCCRYRHALPSGRLRRLPACLPGPPQREPRLLQHSHAASALPVRPPCPDAFHLAVSAALSSLGSAATLPAAPTRARGVAGV
jgi:hypothetical protein